MTNSNENQVIDNMTYKWIARDGDGELYLYKNVPLLSIDHGHFYSEECDYFCIDDNLFPELKPGEKCRIECSIKLKGEPVKP